jgi:hypothetical protein
VGDVKARTGSLQNSWSPLTSSLEKCLFMVTELYFLGFHITSVGFPSTNGKVKATFVAASPTHLTTLQTHLGVINYYGRFFTSKPTE